MGGNHDTSSDEPMTTRGHTLERQVGQLPVEAMRVKALLRGSTSLSNRGEGVGGVRGNEGCPSRKICWVA
jgi:hypothetical protein